MEIHAGALVGISLAVAYLLGRYRGVREEREAERMFRWSRTLRRLEPHADEDGLIGGATVETLASLAADEQEARS